MQSTTERRQQILEFISDNRAVSLQSIMDEFSISRATAKRDVQILSCSYPIYTQQGGGGGVRANDGWYLSHRYLRDDQEALLRSLLTELDPDNQAVIQQILIAFAKPHSKEV